VKWLSPTTIAKLYDMSAKSVHRMIDRGELPAVIFPNGKKRVSQEALEKLLRRSSRKHNSTDPTARLESSVVNVDSRGELPAVQSGGHAHKSA
jgi:predicted site-specific integrase-resolvase